MMEDCALGMSASHGCNDNMVVVESFMEALKQRIGDDRFRMWFADQVEFDAELPGLPMDIGAAHAIASSSSWRFVLTVRGEFAEQRLSRNFMPELRGAAMQATGSPCDVVVHIATEAARQPELPLGGDEADPIQCHEESVGVSPRGASARSSTRRRNLSRGQSSALDVLIAQGLQQNATDPSAKRQSTVPNSKSRAKNSRASKPSAPEGWKQPTLPNIELENSSSKRVSAQDAIKRSPGALSNDAAKPELAAQKAAGIGTAADLPAAVMNLETFVVSESNRLAHTASVMVVQNPGTASPLFLAGPTGVGKTHLLTAISDQLRRHHRMRRVVHSSAERFTNEFIAAIRDSTLTSFRRRYRDVDALLIDDVQFLGKKTATLREMLYTVEELSKSGRPMIFTGNHTPGDMPGLSTELSGRMSAGLVCTIQTMDDSVREKLLRRIVSERCQFEWPHETIQEIGKLIAGDGRAIRGVVNLVCVLQRMYDRMPTIDEVRQFGGDLLRSTTPIVSLSTIERAVCETFHLEKGQLRTHIQSRSVSEPRMLAMYLSRQMTSSAYAEISRYYGGRSHSTAIMASKRVEQWLQAGKNLGRGTAAMSAKDALNRIENILRAG